MNYDLSKIEAQCKSSMYYTRNNPLIAAIIPTKIMIPPCLYCYFVFLLVFTVIQCEQLSIRT